VIGRLRGDLTDLEGTLAVIECAGVGYEVVVPETVLPFLPSVGDVVTLVIRQVVREDGVTLYGFSNAFARRLFDLLVGVNGCGPKSALALLGQVGEDAVVAAILAGDPKPLIRATGVGPKVAERILLELKDKVQEEALRRKIQVATKPKSATVTEEVIDALLALGYRRNEAEAAAAIAAEHATDVEGQVRLALRTLKK
jgi:Holliday junction DNA helicase RuvA